MSHKVLIVDDEPNIVLSLEFLLRNLGYDVVTAFDGDEALALIESERPDLVLLDVVMPKRDGFAVCQAIRARPECQAMRIIMVTARGRDIECEKGMALGADAYVTKPFSSQELLDQVQRLLTQ